MESIESEAAITTDALPIRQDLRHQIDQALLDGQSPQMIAELAISQLRSIVSCSWACVLLIDHGTLEVTVLASSGAPAQVPAPGSHCSFATCGLVPQRTTDGALLIADRVPGYGDLGDCSLLRLPLIANQHTIGVFDIAIAPQQQPDLADLLIVRALCDELALTTQIARLMSETALARDTAQILARRLVEVAENERRLIATELHDEIGQELTALRLLLEQAGSATPTTISEAHRITKHLIDRVRDISLDLSPALLNDLGLLPALLAQHRRLQKRAALQIQFEHEGLLRRFPLSIELAGYRIVQEALTNVLRHAHIDRATIRVWADQQFLFLQIQDAGCGFDPAHTSHGFGLLSMRERATLLGGSFEIESGVGLGTCVTATLPLTSTNSADPRR